MCATRNDAISQRVRQVIALHFDPLMGSPYWLERAATLGFDPRNEITDLAGLGKLGRFDISVLSNRPIEDFVPRRFMEDRRTDFLVAETGGTTGNPSTGIHRRDEFEAAFVSPFVIAARRVEFPRGENWLFIGPSGPHIIGRAASACAKAMGSLDPFTLDFDPRWAKKLPANSFARSRYTEHILEQASRIMRIQKIGVIFSTPPVLASLAQHVSEENRERVRGIHLGGMSVSVELRKQLSCDFPKAILLAGYGNTLFGVAPELAFDSQTGISYFSHGVRLIYQVVNPTTLLAVPAGQRGQVLAHRLDEAQFLPNVLERDTAIRVQPPPMVQEDGFVSDGVCDPQPLVDATITTSLGIY
jgi:phenylacetate-coenzyme A ligase PaaK-like adenylate-forming protein